MGPPQPPQIFCKGCDLSFEVFRQEPPNVRGTYVDLLLILFHKSAPDVWWFSPEDDNPVQITCYATLGLWYFGALYSTHNVAPYAPHSHLALRDKLRLSSPGYLSWATQNVQVSSVL